MRRGAGRCGGKRRGGRGARRGRHRGRVGGRPRGRGGGRGRVGVAEQDLRGRTAHVQRHEQGDERHGSAHCLRCVKEGWVVVEPAYKDEGVTGATPVFFRVVDR